MTSFSDPTVIMFGIYLLARLFIGFLGYRGIDNLDDYILVRFMAAESIATIPAARRISMTWMILCLAGAVAVVFVGIP